MTASKTYTGPGIKDEAPEGGNPPGLLSPLALRLARHELKSVFAKLNVHRQPELVALLAMLLPADQF